MNILILNSFKEWGGDEGWTINVGKGLSQKGHSVVISSRPKSEIEKNALDNGLAIFPFRIGPDIAFWKIPPFMNYLKKNSIDVLLCIQNRDVKIAGFAAKLSGIKAIFHRQGLNTIKRNAFHKIPFTKFTDGIITNTKSIKNYYDSYGWFKKDFIHVIYDGITIPEKLKKIDLHSEFNLKPGSKIIISTGRLDKQKRYDILIKVAAMAKSNNCNWSFIVVGKGKLQKSLIYMTQKMGVSDTIKFIGFRDDMLTVVNSADLFVLSSDYEGMSNSLREGMAVGLPCVSTDVYGVDELFMGGKAGIKVDKGDVRGIFNAINKIFSDDDLRLSLGQNASTLINESFGMERMIDEIEQLFKSELERS